jgi:hypothetical protein
VIAPWAQLARQPGWEDAQELFARECRVVGRMQWDGLVSLAEVGQLLRDARARRSAAVGRAMAIADLQAAGVVAVRPPAPAGPPAPSITCPRCQMTSYHPDDIKERYCGACHMFHDQMTEPPIAAAVARDLAAGTDR